ncbi:MAG: electron transfer flavoprotein-ubiquinone oxidoreductase [Candidatus Eisenbacteria bacterium]
MTTERETLEVDVLIVGGGPAGMAAAYHLRQLLAKTPLAGDISIALIEKGGAIGNHQLSGAVMDPRGLRELMPDYRERGCPIEHDVEEEDLLFLSRGGSTKFPFTPPMLKNHGNHIVSLNKFARWLGEQVEAAGVDLFAGFSGSELLFDGSRVLGVRTGDRGLDRNGAPKRNFEAGIDITAKVTLLAEGVRGSLTKSLVSRLALDQGKNPQIYGTAIKELWEVPAERTEKGRVVHTMGYPLDGQTYGGTWLYTMGNGLLSLGLVIGCDYRSPLTSPHALFQQWKLHSAIRPHLEGGKMVGYGAKAIVEGGWHSLPRPYADGVLLLGDAGGYLNLQRLKGIHLALKTGMLAAETVHEALSRDDTSAAALSSYERRIGESWVGSELRGSRNFRQGFSGGLLSGLVSTGMQIALGGAAPFVDPKMRADHTHMRKLSELKAAGLSTAPLDWKPDDQITFARLTNVFHSGTKHEEDQPCHLVVSDLDLCRTRCVEEYGNPCQYFCPAAVYEMEPDEARGGKKLKINASNCVHCKTCDIMDPYQVITWVPPQGGEGPVYTNL